MRALVGRGVLVSLVWGTPLLAQERDRSLERITVVLEQPVPAVLGIDRAPRAFPKTLGIFTFVPPTRPGEMVRVSIPIGEMLSRAFKGVAAANQRHQEAVARRKVAAALKWFEEQQTSPKQ